LRLLDVLFAIVLEGLVVMTFLPGLLPVLILE
jgi:hypothetical protein